MESLETLQRRIHTVHDLQAVVRTLKALSGASIRQYERAVEAQNDYYRTVELGLQALLRDRPLPPPEPGGATALLVLGSDQGLCGRFNEAVVAEALAQGANRIERLLVVGARAAAALAEAGCRIQPGPDLPGSVRAITGLVEQLLLTLDRWRVADRVATVRVCHNAPAGHGLYQPATRDLLPVPSAVLRPDAAWPGRSLPGFRQARSPL
ncbi:MAG: F0F1 ATP synthase subunit gamma, partial [Candidatus Competibacterales bacterium]|nr:F0F1 ATP synthase subunit gamma [Candidatus Competibacterales bacterium]